MRSLFLILNMLSFLVIIAFFKKHFLDCKVKPLPQNHPQEFLLPPRLDRIIPYGLKKARISGSKVFPKTPTIQTLDQKL